MRTLHEAQARRDTCAACVAIASVVRSAEPGTAPDDATVASLDSAAQWLRSVAPSGGRREALLREAVDAMGGRRWGPRVGAVTPATTSDDVADDESSPSLPAREFAWLELRRTFVFDDAMVVDVEQAPVLRGSNNGMGRAARTGCIVWNCALALALQLRADIADAPVAPRVLELGAGVGVVGLVAARSGARVVCTDLADVCPLLRRNVARECAVAPLRWGDAEQTRAALGAFGGSSARSASPSASASASAPAAAPSAADAAPGRCDIGSAPAPLWVVASDVAYFSDAHADLVATLVALGASRAAATRAAAVAEQGGAAESRPDDFVVWIAHQYRHPRKERIFFERLLPDAGFVVTERALPAPCRDGARVDALLGRRGRAGNGSSLDEFSGVHLFRCVRRYG